MVSRYDILNLILKNAVEWGESLSKENIEIVYNSYKEIINELRKANKKINDLNQKVKEITELKKKINDLNLNYKRKYEKK